MRLIELDRPIARGLKISVLLPALLVTSGALAAARFPALILQDAPEEITEEEPVFLDPDVIEEEPIRLDPAVIEEEPLRFDPAAIEEEPLLFDSDVLESMEIIEELAYSRKATQASASLATDWLLDAQGDQGAWTFTGAGARILGDLSEIPGWADATRQALGASDLGASFTPYHNDIALTALALQALLRRSKYDANNARLDEAMQAAADYLIRQSDPASGAFGPHEGTFMVGHALATEALALYSVGRSTPACLAQAVEFLDKSRNPYAAWRYESPPNGDNDTRLTGYVLLALTAAYQVGAQASHESFSSGMRYLKECEDPGTGRTNYMQYEPYAFRIIERKDSHPAERAEAPTAMHLRLRHQSGLYSKPSDAMRAATRLLESKSPLWSRERGSIDYTYWWQGTEALASWPARGQAWERWRQDLSSALLLHQIRTGPLRGTWPTVDAWSQPGLEAYTAASGALALYAVLDAQ